MKRIIGFLLVLTMLCSFGMAFAQEDAPSEETAAEETAEVTGEAVPAEPEEAAVPAEEDAQEPVQEEPADADDISEKSAEETDDEPVADGATSGTCGTNLKWSLNTSTGVLTISGTGAMKNYEDITATPWYSYTSSIKSIVIENGATSIAGGAFSFCSKLTSVTIPASIKSIGASAFAYSTGIKNIYLSDIAAWCSIVFSDEASNPIGVAGGRCVNGKWVEYPNVYLNGSLIEDLIIPEGVTQITDYSLEFWSFLKSISFPKSLAKLGRNALIGTDAIKDIYYAGSKAEWGAVLTAGGYDYAPFPEGASTWHYNSTGSGTAPVTAHSGTGWEQDISTGKWYYFVNSVMVTNSWKQISSTWYYFGADGAMYSAQWSGNYYLQANGSMAKGWKQIGGYWYYFNASGIKQTGWLQSGSSWYYLRSNGRMAVGMRTIDGSTYYFSASGVMQTGWVSYNGYWYYFKSSGAMTKSAWLQSGSSWYYLNSSGVMVTGMKTIDGSTYYFNASGVMQTGWVSYNGYWYYFRSSGVMTKSAWLQSGSSWYYFKSSGKMATGTFTVDGTAQKFSDDGVWIGEA